MNESDRPALWPREQECNEREEKLEFLLPLLDSTYPTLEEAYFPQGWGVRQAGQNSPSHWPCLRIIAASQLESSQLQAFRVHASRADSPDRFLAVKHFAVLSGAWKGARDLGHLQTCSIVCRELISKGALAVLDRYSHRWSEPGEHSAMDLTKFDIEHHIQFQPVALFCVTIGMTEKFGHPDLLVQLPDASFEQTAIEMLKLVSFNGAVGKNLGPTTTRLDGMARFPQVQYKPVPPAMCLGRSLPSRSVLELVDLVVGRLSILQGDNAHFALKSFQQSVPHWHNYGSSPSKSLPNLPLLPHWNILGVIPGLDTLDSVQKRLGAAYRPMDNVANWVFLDADLGPIRLQVEFNQAGLITDATGNRLSRNDEIFTPQHQRSQLSDKLEGVHRSIKILAIPDEFLVRREEIMFVEHPTLRGHSLMVLAEFDREDQFWQAVLSVNEATPGETEKTLPPQKEITRYDVAHSPEFCEAQVRPEADLVPQYIQLVRTSFEEVLARNLLRPLEMTPALVRCLAVAGTYLLFGRAPRRASFAYSTKELGQTLSDLACDLETFLASTVHLHQDHPLLKDCPELDSNTLHAFLWAFGRAGVDEGSVQAMLLLSSEFENVRLKARQIGIPESASPSPATVVLVGDAGTMPAAQLHCQKCSNPLTHTNQAVEVSERHEHVFFQGQTKVPVVCFQNVPGSIEKGQPSSEDSWFPGSTWTVVNCNKCRALIGWRYRLPGGTFFGLIRPTIAYGEDERNLIYGGLFEIQRALVEEQSPTKVSDLCKKWSSHCQQRVGSGAIVTPVVAHFQQTGEELAVMSKAVIKKTMGLFTASKFSPDDRAEHLSKLKPMKDAWRETLPRNLHKLAFSVELWCNDKLLERFFELSPKELSPLLRKCDQTVLASRIALIGAMVSAALLDQSLDLKLTPLTGLSNLMDYAKEREEDFWQTRERHEMDELSEDEHFFVLSICWLLSATIKTPELNPESIRQSEALLVDFFQPNAEALLDLVLDDGFERYLASLPKPWPNRAWT